MKAVVKPRIDTEGRTSLETVIPLDTPFIVFVDPASACNFQCTFCPTGHRDLIRQTGRYQGAMKYDLFRKIIDDLAEFPAPIKVLRLYKDGEPFLNKNLAKMVAYAKSSGYIKSVDTTTNGTFLDKASIIPVLEAGIDRINISVDGMNNEQYKEFTKFDFDFNNFVRNIEWLYANKGNCEISIKIPDELINVSQKADFYRLFGNHSDRIFVENFSPCWPEFDTEFYTSIKIKGGLYQQPVKEREVCPYIFYAYGVNADGLVSACCVDWGRKLIVGDARETSMVDIWNSPLLNSLRVQHLSGRRADNAVCNNCGSLTHCMVDNIDEHAAKLLDKVLQSGGFEDAMCPPEAASVPV